MSSILGDNIPIGIYRILDDINNLKIRISARKTSTVPITAQDYSESSKTQEHELMKIQNKGDISTSECTFIWQEKISKEKSFKNSIEHSDCHIPLFTYVSTDLSSKVHKDNQWLTLSHMKLENNEIFQANRKFFSSNIKTYQKPCFVKELVRMSKRKSPLYNVGQEMAIMACLEANDSSEAEEVCLCYLRLDSQGVLTVVPDFSHMPYFIQSNKSETYEFVLEHVSQCMESSDAELEKNFLKRISEHHAEIISNIVGSNFKLAKTRKKIYHVLGEIVSAENFEARNLFIRFVLECPKGLVVSDDNSLEGLTNFCKVKRKKNNNGTIAHFGLPLSFQFEAQETEVAKDIRFLLEVSSLDFWNVCRSEGYGCCLLSLSAGHQSFKINTWKLLPQTVIESLKNYFIGQSPYLDDINYLHIPSSSQEVQLSKYGVKTKTSGSVTINFHIIMQYGSDVQ